MLKKKILTKQFDVLNNAFNLYNELIKDSKKNYDRVPKNDKSDAWKQTYDPKKFKDLDYQPIKLKTKLMTDEDENKSSIKQATQLKQLNLNEITKPLWIDLPRKDFNA